MQLEEAIELIKESAQNAITPQTWADLGCGTGLFSLALIETLPQLSTVHAVDIGQQTISSKSVVFHQADFSKDDLPLPTLDGILMANSLHYISDQINCINRLKKYLNNKNGRFVLIEYDTDRPNKWVPYPISFSRAKQIFSAAGFHTIHKLGEHASIYRNEPIYSALITA